ncbi:MAG: hypothetical protein GF317_06660, partial [Candidatus Lokiarchaeota archaeon]|nr:hypothetical protein [Candidatus Lokiarchaeota archaeon]MBD3199395.1 hypothetical protein [Candidatus Lokiarchaeota archaeon]
MNLGLFAAGVLKGALNLPKLHTEVKAAAHAQRRHTLNQLATKNTDFSVQNMLLESLQSEQKAPAELSDQDLDTDFKDQQDNNKQDAPQVSSSLQINPNPRSDADIRSELVEIFNTPFLAEILENWVRKDLSHDSRFKDHLAEFENILQKTKQLSFEQRKDEITKKIKDLIKQKSPSDLRYMGPFGPMYDPLFYLVGVKLDKTKVDDTLLTSRRRIRPKFEHDHRATFTTREVIMELEAQYYHLQDNQRLIMQTIDGEKIPDHVIL